MIFVNYKNYKEGVGDSGLSLLQKMGEVQSVTKVQIFPVVSILDLSYFSGKTLLPLWSQHVDPDGYGPFTGKVNIHRLKELQVKGVFINHSENPSSKLKITQTVKECKNLDIRTLLFCKDIITMSAFLKLRPDYIAFEPPDLVGSTTDSVSSKMPDTIYQASELSKNYGIPLIVGAGIHSKEDVSVALSQGAKGIAVSKDIVLSDNPKSELEDLVKGFI